MVNNFTSLKIKKENDNYKMVNFFYWLSFFFFLASFLFFFINVIVFNLLIYSNRTTRAKSEIKLNIYNFTFKTLDEINFIPRLINDIKIDKEKIYQYYKKKHPSLKKNELIRLINEKIFSFIVINEERSLGVLTNFSGDVFEDELSQTVESYQKNIKKFDFYYFKVRFAGIKEENLALLNQKDIKSFAKEKINFYYQLKISPDQLMKLINKDEQIMLLNNKEIASEKIQDYKHNTPIFDDPDFYELLTEIPVNNYSKIYTLKTTNPLSPTFEEYAFVFFYLEKREGENIPLRLKINKFINKSRIR